MNLWGERAAAFAWPMLWQSSLLIAALFVFDYAFRRKIRASVRYALWLVVLVKLLLPPSLALPTSLAWWVRPSAPVATPTKQERTSTFLISYGDVDLATVPMPTPPAFVPPSKPSLSIGGWAALSWALICVGLFAWLLGRWWQVARDVRRAMVAPEGVNELLKETRRGAVATRRTPSPPRSGGEGGGEEERSIERPLSLPSPPLGAGERVAEGRERGSFMGREGAALMNPRGARRFGWLGSQSAIGLSRRIELRLTERAMSPAVCGLLRPVILLPQSLVARLTPEQLRAVLLHELIHLRRGDVWVNCLQALLQIFYWWHPLFWLANGRIRRVREEAVDDAVMLALADGADAYAPTLLEVARVAFHRPLASLGLVGILESRSALRQRIERLMDFRPPQKAGLTIASTLCVLAFAALAVPMEKSPASVDRAEPPAGETAAELPQTGQGNEPPAEFAANTRDSVDRTRDGAGGDSAPPNLVYISNARQEIIKKLDTIRLDHVSYHGATLDKVVRDLNDAAWLHDPDGRGINFIINPPVQPTAQTQVDPITGLPSLNSEFSDASSTRITIDPPLSDVRLVEALDAIVAAGRGHIKYAIEDYAVVFSSRVLPEPEHLYTRTFRLDVNRFYANLVTLGFLGSLPMEPPAQSERPASQLGYLTSTNSMQGVSIALRNYFNFLGVDLNPLLGKSVFWKDRLGILLIRATKEDLEAIGQGLSKMSVLNSGTAIGQTNRPGSASLPGRRTEATPLVQDARLLLEAGKLDEAEAKLKKAISIDPVNRAAFYYLSLVKEARYRKAETQRGPFADPLQTGEPHYVRTFKVPPDIFYKKLQVQGSSPSGTTKTNSMQEVSVAAQSFFQTLGVNLDPLLGKSVFWNIRAGTLRVMGTKQDLDVIERALSDFPTNQQDGTTAAPPTGAGATNKSTGGSSDPARQTKDKVPVLGDVPLLGRLFRSESNSPPDKAGTNNAARLETLYTRTFKVNPNTFLGNLRALAGLPPDGTPVDDVKQELRNFFGTLGVDLQPPHSIFYNDRNGVLLVRSTMSQLDVVEQAIQAINVTPTRIKITARFAEMPEEVAESLFDEMYLTNRGRFASWSVVISDPEMGRILKQLQAQEGVDLLTLPEATTFSGRQVQIQAVDTRALANGANPRALVSRENSLTNATTNSTSDTQTMPFGPMLDVIPFAATDGYTIQMTVIPSLTEFLGYDGSGVSGLLPLPRFRVRQVTVSAVVWDGQTMMLGSPTDYLVVKKPDGSLETTKYSEPKKKLFVFVTPRLIDDGGNPIHSDDELLLATDSIPAQAPGQR